MIAASLLLGKFLPLALLVLVLVTVSTATFAAVAGKAAKATSDRWRFFSRALLSISLAMKRMAILAGICAGGIIVVFLVAIIQGQDGS